MIQLTFMLFSFMLSFRLMMVFVDGWFRMMPKRFRQPDRRLEFLTYALACVVISTGFHLQMGRFVEVAVEYLP